MAKKQTFEDKTKKGKVAGINVKVVKTVKTEKGSYKFQESYVRLEDVSQVTNIK